MAGALVVVYSSLYGMEAFFDSYPQIREFIGPIGYIIGFVGLLGLYPGLATRSPKLARTGAIFAAIGIVGFLVTIVIRAEVLASEPAAAGAIQGILILIGMILAYLVFSLTSLRTDLHSRVVGLILLGPFLVNGVNFGIVIAGYASPEGRFVTSGLWALSLLAIGVALHMENTPSEPTMVAKHPA